MPFNLSGWELFVILAIALLLFGSRLPSVGRSIGKSIVEFKKGMKDVHDEVNAEGLGTSQLKDRSYRAPLGPSGEERRVSTVEGVDSSREGVARG